MSQYPYVPYGTTVHGQEEIDAVVNVLKTTTQMSKHVRELEEKVSALYDKKYGIGVNSGSSALYLAADLLNYEPGAEIITPALTFSTTVAPLIKKGWVPAFVDVEEGTYNTDVNKVEEMITSNTKAMVIPNLIGNLPDWKQLREIAASAHPSEVALAFVAKEKAHMAAMRWLPQLNPRRGLPLLGQTPGWNKGVIQGIEHQGRHPDAV